MATERKHKTAVLRFGSVDPAGTSPTEIQWGWEVALVACSCPPRPGKPDGSDGVPGVCYYAHSLEVATSFPPSSHRHRLYRTRSSQASVAITSLMNICWDTRIESCSCLAVTEPASFSTSSVPVASRRNSTL